jgi:N6-adenosine-specific RNA methylase IME4
VHDLPVGLGDARRGDADAGGTRTSRVEAVCSAPGLADVMAYAPFTTIVADPPWPYGTSKALIKTLLAEGSGVAKGVGAGDNYALMSLSDLKALPVEKVATENAHLYLWTTNAFLVEAHDLTRSWGFEPKTVLTWVKTKQYTMPEDEQPSMKTGYWFRGATEHVVFGVRGSLRLHGPAAPTVFFHRRLPHSVKPESFFHLVETQSPGPYLEMFARRPRIGWVAWGNELTRKDAA